MHEYLAPLVNQYRRRGVLVDTSLLLLLYVGLHDPERVERFTRTRQIGQEIFTRRDFEAIRKLVGQFERVVITPHILTEVSNFIEQGLHGPVKEKCLAVFALHVAEPSTIEHCPSAESLSREANFTQFGIADTSIVEVAAEPYLVLTTDYRLHGYLLSKGIDAVNYNQLRPFLGVL